MLSDVDTASIVHDEYKSVTSAHAHSSAHAQEGCGAARVPGTDQALTTIFTCCFWCKVESS